MKLAVTWMDPNEDQEARVEGTKDFDPQNDELRACIDAVVDRWEAKGITIDQGGDDSWWEFSLPDWNSDEYTLELAEELLADAERVFSAF